MQLTNKKILRTIKMNKSEKMFKKGIVMGNEYFKTRIKELREKEGLSMQQLAEKIGVNKSRVGMWENMGSVPRMDALKKISEFFDVSIDYLLGNDNTSFLDKENKKLNSLQRNLGKLNEKELEKAENMLKAVFEDIFNDEEDDDDDI